MDIITHSLTGLMLARVVRTDNPSWRSTALLVAASNLPDIDFVSRAAGVLPYLQYHRTYTHSIFAAPILAGLLALIVRPGWRLYAASVATILVHLLLDWTNVHGVALLSPFSQEQYHLDSIFTIDPFIVLPMLFALSMPPLLGLVGSWVSGKMEATPKRGFAIFALLVATAYCGTRVAMHRKALISIAALTAPGEDGIYAFPMRFSLFQWRGIVEREDMTTEIPIDLSTGDYRVERISSRYPASGPVDDVLLASEEFRFALRYAKVPVWSEQRLADVTRLTLIDLRFGPSFDPQFSAEAIQRRNGIIEGGGIVLGPGFE